MYKRCAQVKFALASCALIVMHVMQRICPAKCLYLTCVSHLQVCVFTAPLFSAFCALTTYFLAKEVRNQGAGLFAALFAASVPSYISRSVAGSYDNEGVAIFALVLVFFLYVKVRRHDIQLKPILSCFTCQHFLNAL